MLDLTAGGAGASWYDTPVNAGRSYFDHAATTPVRREAIDAMRPLLEHGDYNASALYAEGRAARAALDGARATVARLIGARPREIVFTSGGSEADTLAIAGTVRSVGVAQAHVVTAATEHHAVLHALDRLRDEGLRVTVLPVDGQGRVDPDGFAAALEPGTTLATIMLANNEIGTLAPIATLAAIARERGVRFHCDAVQAAGRLPIDVDELGVDLLSLSAHKCYGPKGVGALYVRTGTSLRPVVAGGPQEAGMRAGTENVAAIVGFAAAFAATEAERPVEMQRVARLRDDLERDVLATIGGTCVNAARAPRLASIASVAFEGCDAAELLIALDLAGFAVSTGSACAAGAAEPSHVLAAIGARPSVRHGTLRFSLGKHSSVQDVARLVRMLSLAVEATRVGSGDLGTFVSGSP
ncbi:MAG: cysteine desulfurase family protein [Vulcanimicrobiaceae bacterium]